MKKLITLLIVLLLTACKSHEARKPVAQSTDTFIDESIEHNKKLIAFEEGLIQKIIKKDTINNYLTSNSGFWYYYNEQNISPTSRPGFGDKVTFSYNLQHLDGTPIYTTEEIGPRTYVMDKENLFTGLREGLKLMKEGETITFLFPSYNAFGYYGDTKRIGTNVPIKSTVTLHSIQTAEKINTDTTNNTKPNLKIKKEKK